MQIVMLAPFGIRPKGTLLARMLPLAQALVARGHRVTIVAPAVHNPEDAGTRVEYKGVVVVHTQQPRWPALGIVQQVTALLQAALHEHPDVLHLFKPKGYSGLAVLLARVARPRLPLVLDSDDWEGWGGWNDLLPYPYPAKLLFAWQERDLPQRAAAVTVASRTLQTQMHGFGVAPERVVFVPNGVVKSEVRSQKSGARSQETGRQGNRETGRQGELFSASSLQIPASSMHNGQRTTDNGQQITLLLYTRFWEFELVPFVQALVAIMARRPETRLLVIGKGERGEERELLRLAERTGIHGLVDYRGWVAPAEIPALLGSADVALVPLEDTLINRARGLAKLLELMQAGLPIVAHTVGQAGEYIEHGRSGLLVPPGDTAGFAMATIRLLDNKDLRVELGQGAQARVAEHYNWNKLAGDVERAYAIAIHG